MPECYRVTDRKSNKATAFGFSQWAHNPPTADATITPHKESSNGFNDECSPLILPAEKRARCALSADDGWQKWRSLMTKISSSHSFLSLLLADDPRTFIIRAVGYWWPNQKWRCCSSSSALTASFVGVALMNPTTRRFPWNIPTNYLFKN